MSWLVTGWVKKFDRVTRPPDRCQLFLLADEADDEGYCHPGVAYLAECCVMDRKTVMDGQARMERAGVLLVRRPERRGRGRYNEYVVTMGRDPHALAEQYGWPAPPVPLVRSRPEITESDEPGPVQSSAHDPVDAKERYPRSTIPDPAPEPERSVTDPLSVQKRSRKGPPRLDQTHRPKTHNPEKTLASSASAREPETINLNELLRPLAARLAGDGLHTSWDLTESQSLSVVRQLERVGAGALITHAQASVARHGLPRSARAWVPGWEALVAPVTSSASCPHGRGLTSCPACSGRIPDFFE